MFSPPTARSARCGKLIGHVDESYVATDGIKDRLTKLLGDTDEASKELRLAARDTRGWFSRSTGAR